MVKFFGELLRSKNILVLQEAYAALVVAFKASIVKLSDETSVPKKPFATSAAADVKIVLFALECLVDLVNAKGSVLSIWALDPPIFLLLSSPKANYHYSQHVNYSNGGRKTPKNSHNFISSVLSVL